MKAAVFTLGCKVNEVESAAIMSALGEMGIETCDKLCPADIYVLNTCAVTAEAERKSRQLVSRARKFNPTAAIYICGCASEKNAEQFSSLGVKYIGGARDKQNVVKAIEADFIGCDKEGRCLPVLPESERTRAFIKIEDGCNNFCSYCIIPYLRGRVTSRPIAEIAAEVEKSDAPEVVLTGINISAYGEGEGGLTALIKALSFTDKRVRLGSLECGVIDGEFLAACRGLKDFAQQFHLSLQSGSDKVLAAMNRKYTRAQYLEKCALIYSVFPDAAITTDIIAGFCGEDERDFSQSLSLIGEAGFSRVHAFAFSPREGTAAYGREDVPADVKKRRLRALIDEGARAAESFVKRRAGMRYEVIFESFDGAYSAGYTGNYIKVYAEGDVKGKVEVEIVKPFRDGALCEVLS